MQAYVLLIMFLSFLINVFNSSLSYRELFSFQVPLPLGDLDTLIDSSIVL